MQTFYHKLVRDRIPEILAHKGCVCRYKLLDEQQYLQALRQKLLEEAQEVYESGDTQELASELADLYEVLDTLMLQYGLTMGDVRANQEQRRLERGGLTKRIYLLEVSTIENGEG